MCVVEQIHSPPPHTHTLFILHTHSHSQAYSDFSDLEDDLDSQEKTSLRGKIKQFQYVLVVVQDVLGVIGDYDEKIRK